jgi:hypothetical protein
MNTLTKLALGAMGRLRPKPAQGEATPKIALPAPDKAGGMPLMEAISKRSSEREFEPARKRALSVFAKALILAAAFTVGSLYCQQVSAHWRCAEQGAAAPSIPGCAAHRWVIPYARCGGDAATAG